MNVEDREEEVYSIEENSNLGVSLHSLVGFSNPRTMRVKGKVAGQWVVILVDSAVPTNFWIALSKRAKAPICVEEKVHVRLTNKDQLTSEGMGRDVKVLV